MTCSVARLTCTLLLHGYKDFAAANSLSLVKILEKGSSLNLSLGNVLSMFFNFGLSQPEHFIKKGSEFCCSLT